MAAQVKRLLREWSDGDRNAVDELMPIMYDDLRRLARNFLHKEPLKSMRPAELVHETYCRLTGQRCVNWQNRSHFFAIASQAMRRILIDAARQRRAIKRNAEILSLDEAPDIATSVNENLLSLNEAFKELELFNGRQARIVELRYLAGLTIQETAEVIGISPATVKRECAIAKLWLYQRLTGN